MTDQESGIGSKRSSRFFVAESGAEAKEDDGKRHSQFYAPAVSRSDTDSEGEAAPDFQYGRPNSCFYRSALNDNVRMMDLNRVMSMDEMEEGDDGGEDAARFEIVESLMRQWEHKYCDFRHLQVFAGTFNINGQQPCPSLEPWLAHPIEHPPDLYAIGFQELDLSQGAFFAGYSAREGDWAALCAASLHKGDNYVEVGRSRLVGMLLIIYVKKSLMKAGGHFGKSRRKMVDHVCSNHVGTGILNRGGNKGGVGVSFRIFDTSLLFLCSHLAAGSDELTRRNQDYREISRLTFGPTRRGLFDHDAVFWIGDLNYRLADLSADQVKYACLKDDFHTLLPSDQLKIEKEAGRAFAEFHEGELTFQPTYKYDPGTDVWDTSEKGRAPAWCDRVVWVAPTTQVEIKSYYSVPAIKISDHKPVYATFQLRVKEIDDARRQKQYEEALKEGDRRANEALPQVQLSAEGVTHDQFMLNPTFDFGSVHFLQPVAQMLRLRNSGQYPVEFRFRRKDEFGVSRPWLSVTPLSRRVRPGEEAQIHFQVLVDKATAWQLNRDGKGLEDTLVLHLKYGRDFFITVRATFVPSCFGLSLEEAFLRSPQASAGAENLLVDLSDGPGKSASDLEKERQEASARAAGVPFPLWRIVHQIQSRGLQKAELFSQAGSHKDFSAIRDALDGPWEGSGELPGGIHSSVEALLRMLDSLPDPLIPKASTDACLKAAATGAPETQAWAPVWTLPSVNKATLVLLVEFFRLVHANAEHNATDIVLISSMFASVLFGLDAADVDAPDAARKSRLAAASRFLANLISTSTPRNI